MPKITITSIYDNFKVNPKLKSAWGFACVIKMPSETILFDTGGNSAILLSNMQKMQISPNLIDKVVISHIHHDHIGGLKGLLEKNSNVTVFIPHSFPSLVCNMINNKGAKYNKVLNGRKISDFIYSTGELYGPPQEQSLVINTRKGLIIITGCAHPGIISIIKRAQELLKKRKVYLVMGGFHHPPISVVQKLKKIGVKKVAPSHCTGNIVKKAFAQEYKQDFIEYGVGQIIKIPNKGK